MNVKSFFLKSEMRYGKIPYVSPCVLMEVDVFLETCLLVGSVWQKSGVETAGQKSDGYYQESAIEGSDNYWGD
jgi:hypothetical protein